jgi:hypothetical protein
MIETEINAIVKKHLKKSLLLKRDVYLYTEEYKNEWGAGWKESGLYFVFDSLNRVTYIGWSQNYPDRIKVHLKNTNKRFKYDENYLIRVVSGDLLKSLIKGVDELLSKHFIDICVHDIESLCILLYKPKRNKFNYKAFAPAFSIKPALRWNNQDKNATPRVGFTYMEALFYNTKGVRYASNKTKFLFKQRISIFETSNTIARECLPLPVNSISLT